MHKPIFAEKLGFEKLKDKYGNPFWEYRKGPFLLRLEGVSDLYLFHVNPKTGEEFGSGVRLEETLKDAVAWIEEPNWLP